MDEDRVLPITDDRDVAPSDDEVVNPGVDLDAIIVDAAGDDAIDDDKGGLDEDMMEDAMEDDNWGFDDIIDVIVELRD